MVRPAVGPAGHSAYLGGEIRYGGRFVIIILIPRSISQWSSDASYKIPTLIEAQSLEL
jgi:hypothetical protein